MHNAGAWGSPLHRSYFNLLKRTLSPLTVPRHRSFRISLRCTEMLSVLFNVACACDPRTVAEHSCGLLKRCCSLQDWCTSIYASYHFRCARFRSLGCSYPQSRRPRTCWFKLISPLPHSQQLQFRLAVSRTQSIAQLIGAHISIQTSSLASLRFKWPCQRSALVRMVEGLYS